MRCCPGLDYSACIPRPALLASLACAVSVSGQSSVTGTVRTSSGTPVPLVQVVLFDAGGAEVAGSAADNAGVYTIATPPGTYRSLMARVNSMITLTTPGHHSYAAVGDLHRRIGIGDDQRHQRELHQRRGHY